MKLHLHVLLKLVENHMLYTHTHTHTHIHTHTHTQKHTRTHNSINVINCALLYLCNDCRLTENHENIGGFFLAFILVIIFVDMIVLLGLYKFHSKGDLLIRVLKIVVVKILRLVYKLFNSDTFGCMHARGKNYKCNKQVDHEKNSVPWFISTWKIRIAINKQ